MEEVKKRFIQFKIGLLKLSILLTAFLSFGFLLFHIFMYDNRYKFQIEVVESILFISSLFFYKFISEKNFQLFAGLELLLILTTTAFLSIVHQNYYLPIWMFGTLIVFTLCTNLKFGTFFLILSIAVFDYLYFGKVNLYSFLTLNAQFIAYFILGIFLVKKIEYLKEKTFYYEQLLYETSIKDALTKVYNRRFFEKKAKELLKTAQENDEKVLFLIIDIDHFKQINDTFGHPSGDKVLIEVANTIKSILNEKYLFARIGGEEFAILTTNYQEEAIAEIIRKEIENLKVSLPTGDILNVTISIGGIIAKNYNYEYLYKLADQNLYEAKKERNKAIVKSLN